MHMSPVSIPARTVIPYTQSHTPSRRTCARWLILPLSSTLSPINLHTSRPGGPRSAAPRPVDSSAVPENVVTAGCDRERTLAAAAPADGSAGGARGGGGGLCALRGALAVARLGSGEGGAVGGAAMSVAQGVVPPAVVISARVGSRGVYNLPCYF